MPATPTITVIGEALIDLVPAAEPGTFRALPGGSPFNVAVGLARLGQPTALMARLAGNAFGAILRDRAAAEGLLLDAAPRATEPTTLAVVSLDAEGRASYDFYTEGTADWGWTAAETGRAPDGTAVLHFGSLSSWTGPGDEHIRGLAGRLRDRGDVLVSYDPNVRPGLLRDPAAGRAPVERCVALAHLAKASAEDIGWLYPGLGAAAVARRWLDLGAAVVVITDGPAGATAYSAGGAPVHRPARAVTVADTVGAGDAFTAGLLATLARRGLAHPARLPGGPAAGLPGGQAAGLAGLAGALDDAIEVAAVTCERAGADPPRLADLGPGWGQGQRSAAENC